MSIFGKIKDAIFGQHGPLGGQFSGHKDQPAPAAANPQAGAAAPAKPAMPQMGQAQPAPAAQPAAAAQPVDVEAVLTQLAHSKGDPKLNWRSSIVDLMKLLDIDSSLSNREALATELGYGGAKDGSAEMNIWLQKAVMRELENNGGKVPADLKD